MMLQRALGLFNLFGLVCGILVAYGISTNNTGEYGMFALMVICSLCNLALFYKNFIRTFFKELA